VGVFLCPDTDLELDAIKADFKPVQRKVCFLVLGIKNLRVSKRSSIVRVAF